MRTEIGEAGEEATSSEIDLNSSSMGTSGSMTGVNSGAGEDEPSRFENAKQRKTTLLEGIKKFNFKPKRVSCFVRS